MENNHDQRLYKLEQKIIKDCVCLFWSSLVPNFFRMIASLVTSSTSGVDVSEKKKEKTFESIYCMSFFKTITKNSPLILISCLQLRCARDLQAADFKIFFILSCTWAVCLTDDPNFVMAVRKLPGAVVTSSIERIGREITIQVIPFQ